MEFTITIKLGNAAMQTGWDVAGAINATSARISMLGEMTAGESGLIRDENGNTVGRWEVTG